MYDVIVIGCGIVGAATAYELSKYQLKTLILEAENDVSLGATRANSAIMHAGFDPEPGSLMARLNVEGAERAKELCKKLSVHYDQIGSLVVAFSEEELALIKTLYDRGVKNGVKDLKSRRAFKKRTEPFARELRRSLCSHCGNRKSVGILPCFSRNCC